MNDPLDASTYERLLDAASTARERLVVRLAGEAGLGPAEQVRVRPGDVSRRRLDGEVLHFLAVRDDDGERCRRAYLPEGLARAIDEYAATTGADTDARLVDVTPRRVQMLVAEVADRAAAATGDDRLAGLASDDLRRYFARRLLVEEDVDPRVVRAVGGWDGLAALEPYVEPLEELEIAAAFADSNGRGEAGGGSALDDAAGVAVVELDADGRVLGCEGAVEALTGHDPAGLAGAPFGRLFTDAASERARPKELLADAGRDDVTVEDCWVRRADGDRVRLSALVSARRDGDRLEGFVAVLRRADAGEGLAAGAFQRAVDAAGQPVCLADETGELRYVNDAFEGLTGYTRAEAVGRTADELLSADEDTDAFYGAVRRTARDGETWTGQLTTRRKSGERIHVRQTVAPVSDAGEVDFFVAVSADVTERVRRERSLARRCETLEGLEALVADINAAGRELIEGSTREEIEAAVCGSLADSDAYLSAWVGGTDPGDPRVRPREWGADPGDATADPVELEGTALEAALEAEQPRVTGGEFDDAVVGPLDRSAVAGGRAAAVVPLAYGETSYGVLVVFADREAAFGDRERTLLSDLGARLGHAVTAIERRNLLLADTVVELEFSCTDDDAFLVAATREHDCSCTLEAVVPVGEASLLFYVTLSERRPDPFLDTAVAAEGVVDARYIREYDDRSLLEFTVEGSSPALALTELGGTIRAAVVESGTETLRAEIAQETDVRGVVEGVQAAFPDTDLRAKQAVDQPVETVAEFQDSLAARLTDKQRAALRAAYFAGYFDWPRGSTAEEVADSMGVSSPTLHNHLRKAERKLLSSFFEHTRDHIGADTPRPG
jgi:PAS domain S-box-containing protein